MHFSILFFSRRVYKIYATGYAARCTREAIAKWSKWCGLCMIRRHCSIHHGTRFYWALRIVQRRWATTTFFFARIISFCFVLHDKCVALYDSVCVWVCNMREHILAHIRKFHISHFGIRTGTCVWVCVHANERLWVCVGLLFASDKMMMIYFAGNERIGI